MSLFRFILRSLARYRGFHTVAGAGMLLGAAVITGALAVGDSFKGTLRRLALRSLGRTAFVLQRRAGVRAALPKALAAARHWPGRPLLPPTPALRFLGTARSPDQAVPHPAVILGVDPPFFQRLFPNTPKSKVSRISGRTVAVGASFAAALGLAPGDALIVRIGRRAAAPAASIFLPKNLDQTVRGFRCRVGAVISGDAGAFSLRHAEYDPPNLYIDRTWLAQFCGNPDSIHMLLIGVPRRAAAPPATLRQLQECLVETAAIQDYGLHLNPGPANRTFTLTSANLVIPDEFLEPCEKTAETLGMRTAMLSFYLANTIARAGKPGAAVVPYSVIAARAAWPAAPRLRFSDGKPWDRPLRNDEIVLNAWTATRLAATPGAMVRIEYYVAREDGRLDTGAVRLRLRGILPMNSPIEDPTLTPRYPGITDAVALADWHPPFPIDLRRITPADEAYWQRWRTTPKAFVSPALMRYMWQPRSAAGRPAGPAADWITTVRLFPAADSEPRTTAAAFSKRLAAAITRSPAGLRFRNVRREALEAARGSSDFGSLFLGLSMFLIAAAVLFAGLAIRLNATRRAREIGLLLAAGWPRKRVARSLLVEACVPAVAGGLLGVPAGLGYAALLIRGVNTRWQAVTGSGLHLELHASATSLAVGAVAGTAAGILAAAWGLRRLLRLDPLPLLAGWLALAGRPAPHLARNAAAVALAAFTAALALETGAFLGKISPETAFFGAGTTLLIAFLAGFAYRLGKLRTPHPEPPPAVSRRRLAWRANARQWTRSLLVAGIPACGVFLMIAVAAGRRSADAEDLHHKASPAGGFDFVVRSALPLRTSLDLYLLRRASTPGQRSLLRQSTIISCRASEGDAASCLNIQRPVVPRVVGIGPDMIARGGFTFRELDKTLLESAGGRPWNILALDPGNRAVPAFLDADSARWILHKKLGDTLAVPTPLGRTIRLRVAGLIAPSILAGEVVIGEKPFLKYFGSAGGYRLFFVAAPPGQAGSLRRLLQKAAAPLGLEIHGVREILNRLFSVQNAYLAAFATLGGLALALGMAGLALALVRHVQERRGELALLAAVGFEPPRLANLVAAESFQLLLAGTLCGWIAGIAGMGPYFARTGMPPLWNLLGVPVAILGVGLAAAAVGGFAAARGRPLQALRRE